VIDTAASPPALTSQAPERAERLLACVIVAAERPERSLGREPAEEELRARCHALSDRVEWLAQPCGACSYGALLDLERCPPSEAEVICQRLLARLARRGIVIRAGIGPTQTLARLAAIGAAPGAVRALDLDWLAAHAQALPVSLLAQLEPAAITADVTARLRRYGLLTLGHIARLDARDPQALRRQFGPAGAALTALARGADLRPLRPEPPPERVGVRRRFSPDATPEQALAALPAIAARLARRLDARGKQGRELRLRVVWTSGAITRARRRLTRPLHQPGELAQAAQSLLSAQLAPSACGEQPTTTTMTSLTLALGDLSAWLPARPALLFTQASARDERRARAARMERLAAEVGEPLARRYGAPALYRLATTQPDAILPEERAQLIQLIHLGAPSRERPTPDHATARAASNPQEAGAITPPQPHWW
jgi:impB/mucB/samB family protein